MSSSTKLVLADGTEFAGFGFGAPRSSPGEVVFTTGMVGYPESLTDPSYAGQILIGTYPLQGNYGVPTHGTDDPKALSQLESHRIHATGFVVGSLSRTFNHYESTQSLSDWMAAQGIPGIEGVDTRALTRHLRDKGSMMGRIVVENDEGSDEASRFEDINKRNLVAEVSINESVDYGEGKKRIVVVDCGVKHSIIRCLVDRGVQVRRVPWDHDFNAEDADAVLISNGPGDPKNADKTVAHLKVALQNKRPVFGICLGNQLVARAAGAETYKLKFGHRSQNQPCREVGTHRCLITSQNHGFAVDPEKLPDAWRPWFVNANDGTNEGIRHCDLPHRTVQFHPEAKPGPVDAAVLFDEFVAEL